MRIASLVDLATRWWWRAVGREVDLGGEHAWLAAPMGAAGRLDDAWLSTYAAAVGGSTAPAEGLLADVGDLEGPGFSTVGLRSEVADFYEATSSWRIEVWTGWSWWARLPGTLVERWFGRRVGQLAIPTDPLAVARGMDSRITAVTDASGRRLGAGWHRTLRSTGDVVFSGLYGVRTLPTAHRPSVHVTFPLEHGNVQVFLRPEVDPDGALVLRSADRSFGSDGAYVVVRHGRRSWAAKVALHETFRVHVDAEGVLRTDHHLRLGPLRVVTLHYRLDRPA
jgi:hypothetical protein